MRPTVQPVGETNKPEIDNETYCGKLAICPDRPRRRIARVCREQDN